MPHEACKTFETQANQTKERLSIAECRNMHCVWLVLNIDKYCFINTECELNATSS